MNKHVKKFLQKSNSRENESKRKDYTRVDVLNIYENVRFTTPFLVYKYMKYWPFIDFMASYGHLLSNFIVVWIGIYYNVSIFMVFNISCVCIYYAVATIRLN
jgi:hypothetical protein